MVQHVVASMVTEVSDVLMTSNLYRNLCSMVSDYLEEALILIVIPHFLFKEPCSGVNVISDDKLPVSVSCLGQIAFKPI